MSSDKKAKLTLSLALALLCISGIAAGITIARLYVSEKWIRHTYDVEVSVKDLESTLADVGRRRIAYHDSRSEADLVEFGAATNRVPGAVQKIRQLVSDDASELKLVDRLQSNANDRVAISVESVEATQRHQDDPAKDVEFTSRVARSSFETAEITDQMRENEDALLDQRVHTSSALFAVALAILISSSILSGVMFWIHYRLLNGELRQRRAAEKQLRQLSGRLMHLQDEERRRFARELHDSLGQNLAVAKMTMDSLVSAHPSDPRYSDLGGLLEECYSQTRTISYLLHPPLLDELGFASAAKWFIEGFSKRTGIQVTVDISKQAERLPRDLELVLFRILQETLTNIQRHSKSTRAIVSVEAKSEQVSMSVRDYGEGIPKEMLADLEANGAPGGVGLAGISERVREFGGKWDLKSSSAGTEVSVKIPLASSLAAESAPPKGQQAAPATGD
jgi:signal transduction histidine kinase